MIRIRILIVLAVLAHVAWVGTYDTGLGDLMGVVFILLVAALVVPLLVRLARAVLAR